MKSFKNYLTELSGPSHQDLAVDKNMNPAAFINPEVLRKMNAWVGTIAGSPFVLPEEAVAVLRNSLMKIGLTFDAIDESSYPAAEGESKNVSLPLTLFGGRFGKDVDTPIDEFVNDDGISHNVEGGLSLDLEFHRQGDGTTFVGAKIV
mgnify:CR=1 FL=1